MRARLGGSQQRAAAAQRSAVQVAVKLSADLRRGLYNLEVSLSQVEAELSDQPLAALAGVTFASETVDWSPPTPAELDAETVATARQAIAAGTAVAPETAATAPRRRSKSSGGAAPAAPPSAPAEPSAGGEASPTAAE